ncbi:hypothetical protein MMC22_001178 [Lobaria immixta]|nr:hypothetical protein [Lobaria immixta]
MPPGPRIFSGLYQALGIRKGGFFIVQLSNIAPALQVLYVGAVYTSAISIIISLRSTNVYEEKPLAVESKSINEKKRMSGSEWLYIATHLRGQLASDACFLFFAFFLICAIERTNLAGAAPGFSTFNILFDIISAFGNMGVSTGVPYDDFSFCGAWHSASKCVLILVMLRGRHRSLPVAIDRAVLLPGKGLMKRMDRELSGPRRNQAASSSRNREGNGKTKNTKDATWRKMATGWESESNEAGCG